MGHVRVQTGSAISAHAAGVLMAGCLASLVFAADPAEPSRPFLDGFFPIGVFGQPAESFPAWKSRGINTVLEVPMNHDPVAWDRAAQEAGLRVIRRPLPNPRDDVGRTDLLAWSHWDEPDAAGRAPAWTPLFERTFAEWRQIDPARRVFINFAGPDITWFTTRTDDYSRQYAAYYPRLIATADWIASDIYPSGGWLNEAHRSRRGDVTLIAEPMRAIRRLTDKPQFVFIEASEIERGNVPDARCPTPEEMRAQIWYAVVHGARGVFYFPAVVGSGGFRFDGAPPEVVREMERQNALLREVGPALQGPVDPPDVNAKVPPPLVVGWRVHGDEATFIVVNPSRAPAPGSELRLERMGDPSSARVLGTDRSIPIRGGVLVEDFEPLDVRVLVVPMRSGPPASP